MEGAAGNGEMLEVDVENHVEGADGKAQTCKEEELSTTGSGDSEVDEVGE
jgi:hypothetical protein